MHLLIDFDYTLFNTEAMRRACIAAVAKCGITEQDYRAAERELKAKKLYDIEHHLDILATGQTRQVIGEVVAAVLKKTDEFLYPDAVSFLQRHAHHRLTLLSFGVPTWQERKINGAGITDFFNEVVVTNQSKADMLSRWSKDELIAFNDRGSEIDTMKAIRPTLKAVWVRRPATPHRTEICTRADAEVADLSCTVEELFS
jgi:hypothetical protein